MGGHGDDPGQQERDTDNESCDGPQQPGALETVEVLAPDRARELRILGVQRLLDLLEQSLFVLGERHDSSYRRRARTRTPKEYDRNGVFGNQIANPYWRSGSSRLTKVAGRTAPGPNRAAARSAARSAARPSSPAPPRASWRGVVSAAASPSTRTPTSLMRA